MSGQVLLEWPGADAHCALVTLSHAGKFNAMSRHMWRALKTTFEDLAQRESLRCVVLRGEGGHFCAGGDIAEYPSFRFDPQLLADFHENEVWGGLNAILQCPVPVLAAIEGNCMGAGVELASCCDIRVAGASARFGAPIARLGFPMAPREAQVVAQAVGMSTVREMLLEAAVLSAAEMKVRGFLNRVVDDHEVLLDAQERALRIAALAPQAARMNKLTLRALSGGPVDMPALAAVAYQYADSPEHHEGIAAFLGKRKPAF
jgi:enoyl-CoA hydratase/carnithine racemase